jgi:HEAT repeat protein
MSQPDVESLLMEALADSSWLVRETALEVLARRNPDRDLAPVLAKLRGAAGRSKDSLSVEDMLSLGVWRLRQLDPVPKLIQVVEEESDDAMAAAIALGELSDSRATPCLLAALENPKRRLRAASAEALGKIGDEDSIPALARHLDDEQKMVRKESVLALSKLGPEGIQTLQEVAEGAAGRAQRAARKGLRKATD